MLLAAIFVLYVLPMIAFLVASFIEIYKGNTTSVVHFLCDVVIAAMPLVNIIVLTIVLVSNRQAK